MARFDSKSTLLSCAWSFEDLVRLGGDEELDPSGLARFFWIAVSFGGGEDLLRKLLVGEYRYH